MQDKACKQRGKKPMKKQPIGMVAGIAAAAMMTGTAFAGEFVNTSSGRFYNTGYDYCLTGWNWIYETDGQARCYYFDNNGYAYTNRWTPDGYYVNEWGEWVSNGQVVTIGYQSGMQIETDYSQVGGNYNTTRQIYSDGSTNYYNAGDFPVTVGYSNGRCYVTSYFGNNESATEWFENYFTQYSYESSDHTKFLDFIDANNFRILDSNQGTETYYSR